MSSRKNNRCYRCYVLRNVMQPHEQQAAGPAEFSLPAKNPPAGIRIPIEFLPTFAALRFFRTRPILAWFWRARSAGRSNQTVRFLVYPPHRPIESDGSFCPRDEVVSLSVFGNFAINFGVKEVNTLKLGMGGSLTLIMLSLTPPQSQLQLKLRRQVKEELLRFGRIPR